MDEKHLETKNERNFSDSCEETDEYIEDISTANSSEPSLDKKCVSEASVAEDCSSYENCDTCSDEMSNTSCNVLTAESEMNQSDTTNTHGKLSYEIQDNNSDFTEIREQLGYSSDDSGSDSSTDVACEEEVSKPTLKEFANNTNLACSCRNSALYIPTSSCRIIQPEETIHRYFTNLHLFNKITETNPQPIAAQSKEEYEDECASLANTVIPSSDFSDNNVCPYALLREVESLTEDKNNGTLNSIEDVTGVECSFNNNIHRMHAAQSEQCSSINSISSNKSDLSYFLKELKNNDPVLTDMSEIEQCPKRSPTDIKIVGEKTQKNISELTECSKVSKCNESVRKKVSLNNREGISQRLDIPSTSKENHPIETEVNQNRTFKRSLSNSPTEERGSKIMKSSAAESPTRILRNVDINLNKRPASSDDKLSPEIQIKKQKSEKNLF